MTAIFIGGAEAQVSIVTYHNDIARTGQNLNETTLTPSNVNASQFGKLFSQQVNGGILGQPLYLSNVAILDKTTNKVVSHDVVYVASDGGVAYAFDADSNGGENAYPLWQVALHSSAGVNLDGVVGTPVIDTKSSAIYMVSRETQAGVRVFRLHALDLATGVEKYGAPMQIGASVAGTGSDSVGGILTFDPLYQFQRAGLLFLNGVLYVAFGSDNDEGPWHGWIFSYGLNGTTNILQQLDAYCTGPNGSGAGVWMGGSGLAAEVYSSAKPYGRMFFATGNGSFSASLPYSRTMSYGMSLLDLDLTGGMMTVSDVFTPFNEALLNGQDGDLGSGGPVLLPTQTLASGKLLNPLIQIGKSGMFYILDRDNNTDGSNNAAKEYTPAGLGGFNANADKVEQEVQTPVTPGFNWGSGLWGAVAYWNSNIYLGGTNVASTSNYEGGGNPITAYSIQRGVLSVAPTSQSAEQFTYPGPTPSISANGTTNGILWALMTGQEAYGGNETLLAYDATNLGRTLYSSNTYSSRDNPGGALKYVVPTVANGKVFVGAINQLNIYGILNSTPTTPAPAINPPFGTYSTSPTVTISSSIAGSTIYYTTDGSTPTSASTVYQGSFVAAPNETVTAIASATGYLQSGATSATYSSKTSPAKPVFSLLSGSYAGAQTLTITESTPGAIVYYTVDGPIPTPASAVYSQPLMISSSATVQAIAILPGPYSSTVASATYTITPIGAIDFTSGFSLANGPMQFNGSAGLDDFRLQLTNGGVNEAGSAFYATPVNIQQFTTKFTFQLSNPSADGMTFTIQGIGPTALGGVGGSLGYGGIPKSVAIKFDLFSNAGEGADSTGMYQNGALPTVPAVNLTGSGIDLHNGDYIDAAITYNGTSLSLTLTDEVTLKTWSQSFPVNIPAIVGSNTAYVGFTGGTGGLSSSQKITSWLYVPGAPLPSYASGFTPGGLALNGGAFFNGTSLELTDGNENETRSAFFSVPVNVQRFTSTFQFQIINPGADGFTFAIQGNGPAALGGGGGGLGYEGMAKSIAIKFDLYSNLGEGTDSTGLYIDGAGPYLPDVDLSPTGIQLHSDDIFNIGLTYDGTTLTVVIADTKTNATVTQMYTVNIPATVGGSTAFVGFTGASGGNTAVQQVLNWVYAPMPFTGPAFPEGFSSAASQLTLNGGVALIGSLLQLTDGNPGEARSVFATTPVGVQHFATNFDFQLVNPKADGFTFTIQGDSPEALGGSGGSLGYAGITKSLAVKFDLYNSAGEGPDSTGLYLNGAGPQLPAINLTPSGLDLHSGDIFNAQLTYNGTTLTVVTTDTVTNASATQTYTVNIPSVVGGGTAFVGFTAGTGGLTATQNILSWSYFSQPTN